MKCYGKKSGFTLLELVIVIIIIGALASLSLPRMSAMGEMSKSIEAIQSITSVRKSIERCTLSQTVPNYEECDRFDDLDIDDPADTPGSIFDYRIRTTASGFPTLNYRIRAARSDTGGGWGGCFPSSNNDWIEFYYFSDRPSEKQGSGFYENI